MGKNVFGRIGPVNLLLVAVCVAVAARVQAQAETAVEPPDSLVPRSGLLLTNNESRDRARLRFFPPTVSDPVHLKLVQGTLSQYQPAEGEAVLVQDQTWHWTPVDLDENGSTGERGLYLYVPVELAEQRVLVLNAAGHSEAYVNGQPRGADLYGHGWVHLPVLLDKGTNHLLFRAGRGQLRVRLDQPLAGLFVHQADKALPDLVAGETIDTWGAAVIVNATAEAAEGLSLALRGPGLNSVVTPVPSIRPLTIRKVGFRVQGTAPNGPGQLAGVLQLSDATGSPLHSVSCDLNVVGPDQPRTVTFVSEIDGSVQFFSLRPATALSPDDPSPAIVLTCHGAAVDARAQSASYSSKSWFHVVAPTNRRPFGYDWEDFGRLDALEVLRIAQSSLRHDPSRIYITGHSMGGHGAWHLAVTYPDRFAAVGPSAGWLSRSTYGRGGRRTNADPPLDELLSRCHTSGDTVALATNLKQHGVYILHGEQDDNVPVQQARRMAEVLGEFHHDWIYDEQPGQGHWWGHEYGDEGAACVDWPFMFDLFARHALPPSSAVREVDFVTANPGISSRCHWLAIEQQVRQLDISRAHIHMWPVKRHFRGTTQNVAVLRLDVRHVREPGPISVELDGQRLDDVPYPDGDKVLYLGQEAGQWRVIRKPPLYHKGRHRYGGIKDELKHRFLFVFGTRGTSEENAWAYGKARLDAETFWYRGNGSVDMVADSVFDPSGYADRTVVLYGNADTNSVWRALLGESPVQVRRGEVRVRDRCVKGDDLWAVFLRPRQDSDVASVIAVSGSGLIGMRATYLESLFVSAVRFPDCVITRTSTEEGGRSTTIAAGFFGGDWSVENGEFVFAEDGWETRGNESQSQ